MMEEYEYPIDYWKSRTDSAETEIIRLNGIVERYKTALEKIAGLDFRGNRPQEQVIAYNALHASGDDSLPGGEK